MKRTLDLDQLVGADGLAKAIANKYMEFQSYRSEWEDTQTELRNYLYATDTRTTSNEKLPWSNSTTTPKLTQIYDNLKANYEAALFPSSDWMKWVSNNRDSNKPEKRKAIQSYMQNKVDQSDFYEVTGTLLDDFVRTGNCFATVEYSGEGYINELGEYIAGYEGPRVVRISPHDIVFDPTAATFSASPKIVRSLKTLGECRKMAEADPRFNVVFDKMLNNRQSVGQADDVDKSEGYTADGFSSIYNYYAASAVEFLTFYGDIYDVDKGELLTNRIIVVVDRAYIVYDELSPSYMGTDVVFHAGWRSRPDNLYAMGPLDNLVGMQYRIDHLENLKADVFDQIALPMVLIQGDVEDFEFQPGERIIAGEEGNVTYLRPDATALNADFQIQTLENKMEELAGAPRQAMGLRTPGEKTAFEVGVLDNAANRIFNHKARQFEMMFLEPILNAMLDVGRRNFVGSQESSTYDSDVGSTIFSTIVKEDIVGDGRIRPMGARHFEARNKRVQTLSQLIQLKQDPSVGTHLSGKAIAHILAEELNEAELFGDNVGVLETAETQKAMLDAEADVQEDLQMKRDMGI